MSMEVYNKTTHKYILTFYKILGWKEIFLKIIFQNSTLRGFWDHVGNLLGRFVCKSRKVINSFFFFFVNRKGILYIKFLEVSFDGIITYTEH